MVYVHQKYKKYNVNKPFISIFISYMVILLRISGNAV